MSRHSPAIEYPRLGEHERARAGSGNATRHAQPLRDELQKLRCGRLDLRASTNQQCVEIRLTERFGFDRDSHGRAHRAAAIGKDAYIVERLTRRLVGHLEYRDGCGAQDVSSLKYDKSNAVHSGGLRMS